MSHQTRAKTPGKTINSPEEGGGSFLRIIRPPNNLPFPLFLIPEMEVYVGSLF